MQGDGDPLVESKREEQASVADDDMMVAELPQSETERLRMLEQRHLLLREERKKAVAESRFYRDEVQNLRREVRRLSVEMEKLRSPPLIVGTLQDVLTDGRVVVKSSTGPHFVVPVAEFVPPTELIPGTRVSLNQNSLSVVAVLPASKDPLVGGAEIIEKPKESYADIGGLDGAMRELRECVELPLKDPALFEAAGIDPPRGVLLIGSPGTGKTLLAKATAHETNATFIRLVASELVQKFIGEGARRVHEVFQLAREKAPSIVFIDELDAIGARRTDDGTSSNREVERTLMQLLAELDGFDPRGDVKIIAATNRSDILDPALLRPGRFDRIVEVGSPDRASRERILAIHARRMKLAPDVDLADIAARTEGASGADAKAICTEAGMFAVRERRATVTKADFEAALAKVWTKNRSPAQPSEGAAAMFA